MPVNKSTIVIICHTNARHTSYFVAVIYRFLDGRDSDNKLKARTIERSNVFKNLFSFACLSQFPLRFTVFFLVLYYFELSMKLA